MVTDLDMLVFRFPGAGPSEGGNRAATGQGHTARLMAFGSSVPPHRPSKYTAISLEHVLSFLRAHLRENREVLRHAQVSDPALGFLALLEKAGEGEDG